MARGFGIARCVMMTWIGLLALTTIAAAGSVCENVATYEELVELGDGDNDFAFAARTQVVDAQLKRRTSGVPSNVFRKYD